MKLNVARALILSSAVLLVPYLALAQGSGTSNQQQGNVPSEVRQVEDAIERTVERFQIGLSGGVGLDPELVIVGAHAAFAPIFTRNLELRPGFEFGFGEVTTMFAVNLDVIYVLPGATRGTRWMPYIGAGPNIGLSHRGFGTDDGDNVDAEVNGVTVQEDERNRFDFSDTDFNGGMNFIAGARNQGGFFVEMKATAYGVANIRVLAGFNF